MTAIFQSTQPEWAATVFKRKGVFGSFISIHAARVGCDWNGLLSVVGYVAISIHAARVGCDRYHRQVRRPVHISIHAARVGCDGSNQGALNFGWSISIHAARVGCDHPVLMVAV